MTSERVREALRRSFIPRQVRSRPLASVAVAFAMGILIQMRAMLSPMPCAIALAICAIAAISLFCAKRRGAAAAAMMLAALLGGMARTSLEQAALAPVPTHYSAQMEGQIVSEPFTHPDTGRVISRFHIERIDGEPASLDVRLYLRGEAEPLQAIVYGQQLSLTGHIWQADPVTNPYEFDFGAYLNRNDMVNYATAKIENVVIEGETHDFHAAILSVKRAIAARIDRLFPRSASLVRALVLGDRTLLSDELRQALSDTGTAHLISISGLHVTVLAFAVSALLGRWMKKNIASAVTAGLLAVYGLLIGFPAPFTRAYAMFAIMSLASIAGLPSDGITRLCAAMLVYLLAHPLALGDAGFALSYLASAGILLLYEPMQKLLRIDWLRGRRPAHGVKRLLFSSALYLVELLCVSLTVQLATLPAVIAYFGVQSIVALPFNLVCVPLCMAGYVLALAALTLSWVIPPLGALLAVVPDGLLSAMSAIANAGRALPATGIHIGRYPAILLIAHGIVILAASRLSRLPNRWRRLLPIALVLIAGLSTGLTALKTIPFSVTFLDADQADSAVVRTRGHTWVMDTGGTYTPIADYLSATCLYLDGVVLSHPHQDHAGGLKDILEALTPRVIYVPSGWFDQEINSGAVVEGIEMAQSMGIPIIELAAGDVIQLSDRATMRVYSPQEGAVPNSVNDMSLLLLVESEGQGVLFTGDLSMAGEPEEIPDADVLKVAHHGSVKATSQRFVDTATPDIAVISVGENNYGHPSEDVVERLEAAGSEVLLTRECGAITLTWRDGHWMIDTFLEAGDDLE